jgi:hypothetical protein
MDHPDHPAMIQTGAIRLCAAPECESRAGTLADHFEELGICFSGPGDRTPCKALVLLVSPQTSYEKLRPVIMSATVQRASIIIVKMAPGEIPEDARYVLRDAVVIDVGSSVKDLTNRLVGALHRSGALTEKPTLPIRPLP